jgi:3',5'-nucleoside bisphosphate phosphatase
VYPSYLGLLGTCLAERGPDRASTSGTADTTAIRLYNGRNWGLHGRNEAVSESSAGFRPQATPVASATVIDLHTHSNASDGSEPPERVIELAAEAACSAIALTDHDTFEGLGRARRRADEVGIELVAGCEVSCLAPGSGVMHVLAYFVDTEESPLADELVRLRDDRRRRNLALAERLAALDIPVTYEMAVERAGSEAGVGRPHFAAAMVAVGAADSMEDAFDHVLGNDRPGYIPKARLSGSDVASLITGSGGVAVLAHPYSLGFDSSRLAGAVGELKESGFGGIEATYGRYSKRQRQQLKNLAKRFDLVATGGSDYHGESTPDLAVGTGTGDLKVADRILADLEARRPHRRSSGSAMVMK